MEFCFFSVQYRRVSYNCLSLKKNNSPFLVYHFAHYNTAFSYSNFLENSISLFREKNSEGWKYTQWRITKIFSISLYKNTTKLVYTAPILEYTQPMHSLPSMSNLPHASYICLSISILQTQQGVYKSKCWYFEESLHNHVDILQNLLETESQTIWKFFCSVADRYLFILSPST